MQVCSLSNVGFDWKGSSSFAALLWSRLCSTVSFFSAMWWKFLTRCCAICFELDHTCTSMLHHFTDHSLKSAIIQCHILPSTDLYNCALVSIHRSGSLHNWLQWLQHCNAIQWMNCRHSATQAKPQQWLLLQILHGDYSICRQICYPIYFKMQKWLNIVL